MEWPRVPLGELCDVTIGATPPRNRPEYWGGSHVWVTVGELDGGVVVDSREHITDEGIANSSSKLIPAGTLLFSFKLSIGKMAFAGTDLYTNEAIAALPVRDPSILDSKYLYYCLSALDTLGDVDVAAKGKVLNKAKLKRLRIPLPPLSEQRRIVEILDQADRLRRLRAEADAKADRVLPALFIKMFGSPASWRLHSSSRPLCDLVDLISGATPSKRNKLFWNGDIPWVSPKDMKRDFISDAQDHISAAALEETNLKLVEPDNVLLVVRGMILAHSVPVALTNGPVTINQDMKALVPKGNTVSGSYLWAALRVAKPLLQALVRTAAHGTRKLDTPDLMQLCVVEPTQNQLKECESAVRTHQAQLDARGQRQKRLGTLFDLLLHRAFSGALTASWRQAHMKQLLQEMEQQAKALANAEAAG